MHNHIFGRSALESDMKLTQGTYWTRCSSAFFSSASLFNTARMISCSSSVRKLRSIMMTAAAAPPSAFHCFECVANDSTWLMLYALLVSSRFILFCSHKLSQWQCFTHTGSSIIQNDHIEMACYYCLLLVVWSFDGLRYVLLQLVMLSAALFDTLLTSWNLKENREKSHDFMRTQERYLLWRFTSW